MIRMPHTLDTIALSKIKRIICDTRGCCNHNPSGFGLMIRQLGCDSVMMPRLFRIIRANGMLIGSL